jgi:hypothetical protein
MISSVGQEEIVILVDRNLRRRGKARGAPGAIGASRNARFARKRCETVGLILRLALSYRAPKSDQDGPEDN